MFHAFVRTLEHGTCAGVPIPHSDGAVGALAATLPSEEQAYAAQLAPHRRRTWVGGRAAMREALAALAIDAPPIFADDRGAPTLPDGVAGSISHKGSLAVALVQVGGVGRVGVDVEIDAPRPPGSVDIASRVLADDEAIELAFWPRDAHVREVLLRFSAKEALYKALDPFVRRYVGFKEVSISPRPDGGAVVTAHLGASEGPFRIEVRWLRENGIVLTTARVDLG